MLGLNRKYHKMIGHNLGGVSHHTQVPGVFFEGRSDQGGINNDQRCLVFFHWVQLVQDTPPKNEHGRLENQLI